MSSSCPYCGAPLKLKFCVVCGRQSKLNKMGNLRSVSRNTDATTRLQDPFIEDDINPQKALRFHRSMRPVAEAIFGGLVAGTLLFCAAKQALNFYTSGNMHNFALPWMKTHHFEIRNNWPGKINFKTRQQINSGHKTDAHHKSLRKTKNKK